MSVTLRENGWTDLHEILREGVEWPWDDLVTFWANSVNGSAGQRSICLLSKLLPVELDISFASLHSLGGSTFCPWRLISLTGQYHSLGGSRGRGLLCLAPQLVDWLIDWTRKCAVDYYTTAYRRSESDVAYGGATWQVMLLDIGYRPIE